MPCPPRTWLCLTLPMAECKHDAAVVCLSFREDFHDAAGRVDYQRKAEGGSRRASTPPRALSARGGRTDGHPYRVRHESVRGLHRADRRRGGEVVQRSEE